MLTRLRVPISLTVSILGLASCSTPEAPDAAADGAPALDCDAVCRSRQTVYIRSCVPASDDSGLACQVARDGGGAFCAGVTAFYTASGGCCCQPVV
ncbi:MAG: hypothetical protein WCJ30_10700 [Deltaproteobacteria bacterium]